MTEFTYKGLIVYPYTAGRVGRRVKKLCIANPNHNYDYDAKGITLASGIGSPEEARAWIDANT